MITKLEKLFPLSGSDLRGRMEPGTIHLRIAANFDALTCVNNSCSAMSFDFSIEPTLCRDCRKINRGCSN